jgi:hypothetical protein
MQITTATPVIWSLVARQESTMKGLRVVKNFADQRRKNLPQPASLHFET